MPASSESYPWGTLVRIAPREQLEEFLRTWRLHHPLEPDQLAHAGRIVAVTSVSWYEGGEALYELAGVPGLWHGRLLEPVRLQLAQRGS